MREPGLRGQLFSKKRFKHKGMSLTPYFGTETGERHGVACQVCRWNGGGGRGWSRKEHKRRVGHLPRLPRRVASTDQARLGPSSCAASSWTAAAHDAAEAPGTAASTGHFIWMSGTNPTTTRAAAEDRNGREKTRIVSHPNRVRLHMSSRGFRDRRDCQTHMFPPNLASHDPGGAGNRDGGGEEKRRLPPPQRTPSA